MISGSDGGISGYITIRASSFSLPNITSVGVAVTEPGSSGTIFELDTCYIEPLNCNPTGTSEIFTIPKILYANPFGNNLEIHIESDELTEIALYDISSRKVLGKTFVKSARLNTEELNKGVYFLVLRNKNGLIHREKLIKE
jgi:hypothetical protein